jgi:NitT/TauT family transport system substrate-binding protein
MGYIPDIQFAPFYVAQSKNYYADEGLHVTFVHGSIQDKIIQTAQGQLTFVNASGDEVLLARSTGIPIKAVFQTEQQSPIAIFSKKSSGIAKPEDLRGKTIGVPGRYGATYYGLLGVLSNAGLSEGDVRITEVGFTQGTAVREDQVEAAVGYANNEPLVLEREGIPMNVLRVSEYFALAGNNIVTSERTIADDPELVQRFVRATARGLQDTIADPDEAFGIALPFVSELSAEQQPRELQKLKETIALWQPNDTANEIGYVDPQQWQTTYQVLRDSGVIAQDLDVTEAFTNDLRP